jgi:C_GCAxxG_C_C family probable redox protein
VLNIKLNIPAATLATAFHGGGGGTKVGEQWTATGCMCGALAAGVLAIGALYGRKSPKESRYGCAAHVSGELHRRFQEELGAKCCSMIRPFYKKIDADKACGPVYMKGAELAVEVLFSAPKIHEECKMPASLRKLIT